MIGAASSGAFAFSPLPAELALGFALLPQVAIVVAPWQQEAEAAAQQIQTLQYPAKRMTGKPFAARAWGKDNGVSCQSLALAGVVAMLKANVGLSRKITRDYNSTGYSVNLEGEIPAPVDDAEGVVEKVRELFHLAQEALAQEIDRDQGEDSIGRRDEERPSQPQPQPGNGRDNRSPSPNQPQRDEDKRNPQRNGQEEPATNKQVQYLLSLAKRQHLSTPQLEAKIAETVGAKTDVYQLSKRNAGLVIEALSNGETSANSRR